MADLGELEYQIDGLPANVICNTDSKNLGELEYQVDGLPSPLLKQQTTTGVGSPNVSDTVTVEESVTLAFDHWNVSASDTVTVTDVATAPTIASEALTPSAYDNVNIVDAIDQGGEDVTVDDYVEAQLSGGADLTVPSSYDSVTVTDTPTIQFSDLEASASDTVSVNDVISGIDFSDLEAIASDTVSITESTSVDKPLSPSASDTVDAEDSITNDIVLPPSGSESVGITEDVSINLPLSVTAIDSIVVTEDNVIVIDPLYVNASDTVTITEDNDVEKSLPAGSTYFIYQNGRIEAFCNGQLVATFGGADFIIYSNEQIQIGENVTLG